MTGEIRLGGHTWQWGQRTYIMGILNVTPDSFFDGGIFADPAQALKHARRMAEEGADIIDVGGESTRPGSLPVTAEQEITRIIPVLKMLKAELDIPISVDTYRAKTAEAAIKAGVDMINDVWGLKADPNMAGVIAGYGVPVCIMHNSSSSEYRSLIDDIVAGLHQGIEAAHKAGVKDENIVIDPGIGFGKSGDQNIEVIARLERFKAMGYPLLLGASRKSFIGRVLDLPVNERLEGTLAVTVLGIAKGADVVRVHDVWQNRRVAIMADRIVRNKWTG
ncbi:MAG: Dihydropteroate synthase [candidate division WS2 bacterium]|uniref:Dihydropteroate synthase n=1 Tax=Psychracetigena formicireducens TaxID=2986056 RepID=A0A9E2BGE0_PSYF1|nr:Dihydropteroate synthase [Candidatus Psychracetigena formicireducens]MBT9144427.1 Dihydropteroate synthase [Candidatus Psychracetigena formicireducens]